MLETLGLRTFPVFDTPEGYWHLVATLGTDQKAVLAIDTLEGRCPSVAVLERAQSEACHHKLENLRFRSVEAVHMLVGNRSAANNQVLTGRRPVFQNTMGMTSRTLR